MEVHQLQANPIRVIEIELVLPVLANLELLVVHAT